MENQAENVGPINDEVLMRLVLELFKDKTSEPNISALAEAAGIGYDTAYSIVIRKKLNPSAKNLKQLAKALDCSVDYLLGNTKYRHLPIEELPEVVRQMARIAVDLPGMRQADLLLLAKTYAEHKEETRRQVLQDVTELVVRGAVDTGQAEELAQFVRQLNEALRKRHKPSDTDDGDQDDDDAGGPEEPLQE